MIPVGLAVVGGLLVIPNTILRVQGATLLSLLVKTVCGVVFVLTAVTAILSHPAIAADHRWLRLGLCLVVGLVLGLLGDVWLALKELSPEAYDAYLFLGMLFFGLGHVAFIAGLLWTSPEAPPQLLVAGILAAAVAGSVFLAEQRLRLDFGHFRWVAAGYGFTLCFMGALAWLTAGAGVQPRVMGVGGLLFALSDFVLAFAYFGPGKDKPWSHALCYVFYYGAQFTIALSLLAV
jgi:hypothetical protein